MDGMMENPYQPPKEVDERKGSKRGCFGGILMALGSVLLLRSLSLAVLWWLDDPEWQKSRPGIETWNRTVVLIMLSAILTGVGFGFVLWSRLASKSLPKS